MTEPVQQVEKREARDEAEPPSPRRTRRLRLLPVGGVVLVAAVFFALTLAQSLRQSWNGDTANVTLQGWDLIHGQVRLHGWWSTDVNFYTLDLPIYAVNVLIFGLGSTAPHVAGAMVYTVIFLAAAWLAKGRATGGAAWLRVALVAMFMTGVLFAGSGIVTNVMVPDHNGTVSFFLVSYVLYDRFADRRWGPWAMLAVLTLGQIGDVSTRYVAVPALILVWGIDHLRQRRLRTPETRVVVAVICSVVLSFALRQAMIALGWYYLAKAPTSLAPLSDAGWHFTGMWESLLNLFGMDITNFPGNTGVRVATTVVGAITLLCGLLSLIQVLLRWTKVDPADRLLALSIVIYLAAYEFSTVGIRGNGGGYEFVGVVALFAVLSARTIASLPPMRLPSFRLAGTAVAGIAAFAYLLSGTPLFQSYVRSPQQPLGTWLEEHDLNYGLAEYWNSSPITVYTGGRVSVRQIILVPGGFVPRAWNARQQWYDATQHDARFVIAGGSGQGQGLLPAEVESSFGKPTAEYQFGQYTIMVYGYNLLTKGTAPALGPED